MNYVKTGILLILLTVLLVFVGSLIGGKEGAIIAFIFALVMNGVSYWFSDKIVIAMYRARPVTEADARDLYRIVREAARSANIPAPKVYVIPQASPNAFATGRDPKHAAVCVTQGITEILDYEELKGVISHEMAHIKNRDTLIMTVTASVAGAIMMLANMARWAAIIGTGDRGSRRGSGNMIAVLAVSIIAPIAALLVQLAISRSREYAADKRGAMLAHSPYGLAKALKKLEQASKVRVMETAPQTAHLFIVNPLRGNALAALFSTHPPVAERVKRLEAMRF